MGKKKADKRPARGRYKMGSELRNKERKVLNEQIRQDFFKLRNDLISKNPGIGKANAKRAARLVINGVTEEEAVAKAKTYKQK